ncbi:Stk1 family PASTA domain-containing Ser/Thr kinase [Arsenicicoccus dermatophilus]|uniref:Stk1 family PASTA domain-containing Ser/Thr kinase n=1 Tax=Arsenicicoccus dermatophilus TaxID=1076331 RepID=UPI001F4CAD04|nr:Stk1 family PASTA domain-containing Ser/Thr kinase [Arsenicicoccus dermatophilus]MCH8614060.1 Stk1 family PASTA domain-containing Ser/Thr kinase [Arsenicicoccus dermatophilus]
MNRLVGGRYDIGDEIGRGGMATVHAAYDTRLGRAVAVKMLHAGRLGDRTFQGRFRREAHAAASLSHPNIVAVFDSGEDIVENAVGVTEVVPYIVMELVEGHTLSQLMHDQGPFSPEDAMRIGEQILAGLGYSHERGIVHRDVKPGNVMLTGDGMVKVMDFGIARGGMGPDSTATMTQTQAVIGTAQYLSPEQARGQVVDGRSDLYSAGCLLFELVTGRPPFIGDSPLAIAYQHVGEDPTLPSTHDRTIPRSLDTVIMHALIKDRDRRYQTAEAFAADLRAAREGRPLSEDARTTAAALFDPTDSLDRTETIPGNTSHLAGATAAVPAMTGSDLAPVPGPSPALPGPQGYRTSSQPPVAERGPGRYIAWIVALLLLIGLVGFGAWRVLKPPAKQVVLVTVPDLMGETEKVAQAKLRSVGLVGDFQRKQSNAAKDTVIGQSPVGGSQQDKTNAVAIVISTGPTSVAVPDVRKYSQGSARQRLVDAQLLPGVVTKVDDKVVPAGQIVGTEPAIGTTVPVGSSVGLQVSTGRAPVPNVEGQDYEAAAKVLSDAGFRPARKDRPSSQTVGTVLEQDIKEGTQPPGPRSRSRWPPRSPPPSPPPRSR